MMPVISASHTSALLDIPFKKAASKRQGVRRRINRGKSYCVERKQSCNLRAWFACGIGNSKTTKVCGTVFEKDPFSAICLGSDRYFHVNREDLKPREFVQLPASARMSN